MIRTRLAGTRVLLVGLAAAAVVTGSAAGSLPVVKVSVHARLAPVTGTNAAGRFSGLLVKSGDTAYPRTGQKWSLSWKVRLTSVRGLAKASLRIPARNGAPLSLRVLCSGCEGTTSGRLMLTNSQAIRVAQSHATVVVLAPSTTLRGAVKAQAILPKPQS